MLFGFFQEFARLNLLFVFPFLPLLFFGLIGLYKLKRFDFIAFFFCLCLGAVVFDLRVMVTAQLFLLFGWVYWIKKRPRVFVLLSFLMGVLFIVWWFSQKAWYAGLF